MYTTCLIKNNTGLINTLNGHEFQIAEEYQIQDSQRMTWANSDAVLSAIGNESYAIGNGESYFTTIADQLDWLRGNKIAVSTVDNISSGEITSLGIKNFHTVEPWGSAKGYIVPSQYCCAITLSNKDVTGLIFNYNSDVTLEPEVGQYVFQENSTKHSWITDVDTINHVVTFDLPELDNGAGYYRKGYYIDCKIRDYKSLMYLWGMFIEVTNANKDDFIELDVIDKDNLFDSDAYCQALFGVDAINATPYIEAFGFEKLGEFSEWCKYYDESWVINLNSKLVVTPDGAPGTLLVNHYLRMVYYPAATDSTPVEVFLDYNPTSKDSDT